MKKMRLKAIMTSVVFGLSLFSTIHPFKAYATTDYPIWINNVQLSDEVTSVVCGSGTVTYNAATNTLTMNNATIDTGCEIDYLGSGILSRTNGLNMVVVGDCSIINTGGEGVSSYDGGSGDLKVSGTGTLTIKEDTPYYGYGIYWDGNVIVDGVELNIESACTGIWAKDSVEIKNSTIDVNAVEVDAYTPEGMKKISGYGIVSANGTITIDNSSVVAKSGKLSAFLTGENVDTSKIILKKVNLLEGSYDGAMVRLEKQLGSTDPFSLPVATIEKSTDMDYVIRDGVSAVFTPDSPVMVGDFSEYDGVKIDYYNPMQDTSMLESGYSKLVEYHIQIPVNAYVGDSLTGTITLPLPDGYDGATAKLLGGNVAKSSTAKTVSFEVTLDVAGGYATAYGMMVEYRKNVVPVTKITLNKTSVTLDTNKKTTLSVKSITPSNATNKAVKWTSSNASVAKVNASTGEVTALKAGKATITCTAKDGSGTKATCTVTVVQKVTKLTLNKTSAGIAIKEKVTLKATIAPSNASDKTVTWTSSNTKIATVSATGVVTGVAPGTVTITCTAKDGSKKYATCKVQVYTNTEAFVARIYTKALGREPEAAGLAYWSKEINNKSKTPVWVAELFIFSDEFQNKKLSDTEYIKVLYRTFMGREYDQAGLNYWLSQLKAGKTRKQVLESFASCPEFQSIIKSFGL